VKEKEEKEEKEEDVGRRALQPAPRRPASPEAPPSKRLRPDGPQASAQPVSRQRQAALQVQGHILSAKTLQTYMQPATALLTSLMTKNLSATSCSYHGAVPNITGA